MKYKLAYFLVWFCRLFTKVNSYEYYRKTFLMEDILDEANREYISNFMGIKKWPSEGV
jgi:hypothetical protein